ncbi:MAG: class I SAM-dependent methyltransferase, partial [Planctomycetes bacterium]|nr:class I SAM-dependent methyltransferase [Planctomycetota bacterium]
MIAAVGLPARAAGAAAGTTVGGRGETARLAGQILRATNMTGGLVVHLGCGDGRLTAALHASDSYLVQGLSRDEADVERARRYIQSLGLYGPVSVDRLRGERLPYAENLVDLVVATAPPDVPAAEIMRVLRPGGAAYVRRGGRWEMTVKPRPADIDDWTHFLHSADNNAVARDTVVGPPRRMHWLAGPLWCRGHEIVSSLSAMVSAGGRLFYV